MEGINVTMKSACQKSFYHGIKIPNDGLVLSHLFYADDVIFVRSWEYLNFSNISRILRCFHTASSLKVNFHKCNVYGVGVAEGEVKNCARVLGCGMDSLPFKFVGVSVRANMNIKRNWQSVIDQIQNKLSSWKAGAFSFGGLANLVKFVLGSLPLYYLSLFLAPKSIIEYL